MLVGNGPLNWFPKRERWVSCPREVISFGMGPVMVLDSSRRTVMPVQLVKPAPLRGPLTLADWSRRSVRDGKLYKKDGIGAGFNRFPPARNTWMLGTLANVAGMAPVKEFIMTSNTNKFCKLPISWGMAPVNMLELERSKPFTKRSNNNNNLGETHTQTRTILFQNQPHIGENVPRVPAFPISDGMVPPTMLPVISKATCVFKSGGRAHTQQQQHG